MSTTSRKRANATYRISAISGARNLTALEARWQLVELALVWTTATHCYMVPLRSLSTICRVQNKLGRVVANIITCKRHTVDLLRNLHWLLIGSRITFKVVTLCYRAYHLNQPNQQHVTLKQYVPRRELRSVEMNLLTVPRPRTKSAERPLSSVAPTVWNELPLKIGKFKSPLKAHLLSRHFFQKTEVLICVPDSIFDMFIY